jgi:hypothetical protein
VPLNRDPSGTEKRIREIDVVGSRSTTRAEVSDSDINMITVFDSRMSSWLKIDRRRHKNSVLPAIHTIVVVR